MSERKIRGVTPSQEAGVSFRRDTRPLTRQLLDGLRSPTTAAVTIAAMGAAGFFVPAFAHFAPLIAGWIALVQVSNKRNRRLPLRLPKTAERIDLNDPEPGRKKHRKADGIIHLGNAIEESNQELWIKKGDALTHELIIATTGSGKTYMLTGQSANYVGIGGGLIYADAKAAPDLAWGIAAIARRMGREDDFLVINYMTGNKAVGRASSDKSTNTANPLATGSADSLVQIMSSLIPSPEGDNAVFGERALTMITAVLYGLVDLRDGGHIDLGVQTLRECVPLERVEALAFDPRMRSETARNALMAYLRSLPNWKPPEERVQRNKLGQPMKAPDGKPILEPIADEAGRQHGFSQMYFTRALSSLTDTYGHIYWGSLGEVDFIDVVRRRRILVIMLPALEKSLAELQNLGKINLAALRDAISTGLGGSLEGTRRAVLETLPTASPIPTKIICDEYGYMAVEGFAVVAAQARGLGFSVTWAGQDWAGIKRGSEKEAEQVWGNTNLKVFGRLQDQESFTRLNTAVGEAKLTQAAGFEVDREGLGSYRDNMNASIEKIGRVDFTDLQSQIEGETHIVFGGALIRAQMFNAALTPIPELRVNRYLRVGERIALDPAHTEAPAKTDGPAFEPTRGPSTDAPPPLSTEMSSARERAPTRRPDPPRRPPEREIASEPPVRRPAPPPATPATPPEPAAPPQRPTRAVEPQQPSPIDDVAGAFPRQAEKARPAGNPAAADAALAAALDRYPDDDMLLSDAYYQGPTHTTPDPLFAPPLTTGTPAALPTDAAASPAPTEALADPSLAEHGAWTEIAPADDLPDSRPLHELLGIDTVEGRRIKEVVGKAIAAYPTAEAMDAAKSLSPDKIAADLREALNHFVHGDEDDDGIGPH